MSLAFKRLNYRVHLINKPLLASRAPSTTTRLPPHYHNIARPIITTRPRSTTATMSTTSPTDPIIDQLKAYTTCDVSNALVKLRHPTGGFLPGLTLWSPDRQAGDTRIVGPAYTVLYAPLADPSPRYSAGHYIDGVPAGAVVFVSSPPGTPNAVYGGLMTARARARGAVGTVVDGRFRDLQEQREMGFPVFGRDVGTAPPQGLLKVVGVDVPVRVGLGLAGPGVQDGVEEEAKVQQVRPGDYIIGDLNGVVVLPRELAAEVLPLMEKGVAADDRMMVEIRKGMGFEEASKKFRG